MVKASAVAWVVREPPLRAVAVAARGAAARALASKLAGASDDRLSHLCGVAGRDVILLLGDTDALPWVDGAIYLGRDPHAQSLLLPATRAPSIHAELFERAVLRDRHSSGSPIAILLDPPAAVPISAPLPLSRERLVAWLKDQETAP